MTTRTIVAVSIGWLGMSMVSDGVPALLLPYQLLSQGDSDATRLGMTTLVGIAVGAALQPFAGRWSDARGRVPVMVAGVVITLVGLALLVAPTTALPGTVVALTGVSIAQAGYQPLVPDHVGTQRRGRAAGAKGACDVGGAFLAFLVLAVLLGAGAPGAAALLLAGALVGSFVVASVLLPEARVGRNPSALAHRLGAVAAYRLDLAEHRGLVTLVIGRFLFLLGIYVVGRFLLLFIADRFGMTPEAAGEEAGLLLAMLALLTVAASLPAGWLADRLGRRPPMLAGGMLAAIGIALLPTAGSTELLLLFGGLMALGSAAFSAGSWALLTDLTPARDAGRLLGLANLGTAGAAAAAGSFGLLIDAGNRMAAGSGYGIAFGISAALTVLGGAVAWKAAVVPRQASRPTAADLPPNERRSAG